MCSMHLSVLKRMYSYLKFASMRVHRKLCEVHGTHEFYSCRQNKKSLVYSVHPQSLKNFKHNFYVLVFRGKYNVFVKLGTISKAVLTWSLPSTDKLWKPFNLKISVSGNHILSTKASSTGIHSSAGAEMEVLFEFSIFLGVSKRGVIFKKYSL